jgi:Holliday junction resolvase RusA-like endonuclease
MLHVWLPFLPPSSNNIYIRHPQGKGRILSHEARTFKIRAMREMQDSGIAFVKTEQNVPYRLHLAVFFPQVEVVKSSVGARYKKIDLSNMVKLVEDTVAEATGLDDCHNFQLFLEKHCDEKHPGMYVGLKRIHEHNVGLTREAYDEREVRRSKRN